MRDQDQPDNPPAAGDETTPLNPPLWSGGAGESLHPGLVLSEIYRLERQLGQGGMGQVWLASHILLQEPRAIKLILQAFAQDPHVRQRFIQGEARLSLRLQHPNITRVFDLGQHRTIPYLVMEYVPGPAGKHGSDLKSRLNAEGKFDPERTADLLDQIAAGLEAAHRQGLIHRDFKPANLLLSEEGVIKISDFGLVKDLAGDLDLGITAGYGLGSPVYMAPEQARGQAGFQSDIYSLGVVLFEMLTGQLPFTGDPYSLLLHHHQTPPPLLHLLEPSLSPALSLVVTQAMAKKPEERYGSALELAQAFRAAVYGNILVHDAATSISTPAKPAGRVSPPAPPGGLLSFLFTDIEGSTQLWEHHPLEMKVALARHDLILREAIEGEGGYVFKMIGDAFNAVFTNPLSATKAALSAQQRLAQEEWPAGIGAIKVRMALHTCEAENRQGDFVNPNLNRIARIQAVAYGGQILLSNVVAEAVKDRLASLPAGGWAEGVHLKDLGERRLRDLIQPEHIYQLCAPGLVEEFPPLKTLDYLPNNLPTQFSSFVGRENEVAEVVQLLHRHRLVTLTGVGGSGKTRLSLAVAAEALPQFPDGAYFVELANLTDPDLLPGEIAVILGVQESPGKTLFESLKSHLQSKKLLLVLDNYEQLIKGKTVPVELLKAAPDLKIIVTSRIALVVSPEREYPVEPLPLPEISQKDLARPERLLENPAVALFVERGQSARPGFALTKENAGAIIEICVKIDGLPLAIELAAARVKVLTPHSILARLNERFKVLRAGELELPERQQTLRGVIEWSYDLLKEWEKRLFERLGVFVGGSYLEGVEEIGSGAGVLREDVLDGLESLVNKRLVRLTEQGEEMRYGMLETIREFGMEKLTERGESEAVLDRFGAYCREVTDRCNRKLRGPEEMVALQRLGLEYPNLRTALDWYIRQDRAEDALGAGSSLLNFWSIRSFYTEGRTYLNRTLSMPVKNKYTPARGKTLYAAAFLAFSQGLYEEAARLINESLDINRFLDNREGLAQALYILGVLAINQEDYNQARKALEECLNLRRETGDRTGTASVLNNLSWLSYEQGDYAAARKYVEECLSITRELKSVIMLASSLVSLANIEQRQGYYQEAIEHYRESLKLSTQLGSVKYLAACTACLASATGKYGMTLEGVGRTKYLTRSARLSGGTSKLLGNIETNLDKAEREFYEEALETVRSGLGDKAFEAAFGGGKAMSGEAVTAYGLQEIGQDG